jgi:lipopolysaccharide/colanic/teichoic acid biosynthesis glycosyltransferase
MDVAYQSKWSIFYDLQLLLRTFQVVATKNGAC